MESTVFTLGTSSVVTIPKKLGIKPGSKVKFTKTKSKTLAEFENTVNKKTQIAKDIALIKKLAGSSKVTTTLTSDEMNKLYEQETYDIKSE